MADRGGEALTVAARKNAGWLSETVVALAGVPVVRAFSFTLSNGDG
jgi:hypothetical protein